MERSQWYKVRGKGINASLGDVDGVRIANATLFDGMIVPDEWFEHVGDNIVGILLNPDSGGRHVIDAYEPQDDEYPFLYSIYPGAIPAGATFPIEAAVEAMRGEWFRVVTTHVKNNVVVGAFNGIAVLCDVPGVCKVGDVAAVGDVIPVEWLSGLSVANVRRLMAFYLPPLPNNQPRETLSYIQQYKPNPYELDDLYRRYPGSNPDYKAKTTKKKQAIVEETQDASMDS